MTRIPGPIDIQQSTPILDNINGVLALPSINGEQLLNVKASYNQLLNVQEKSDNLTYELITRFSFPGTNNLQGNPDTAKIVTEFSDPPVSTASVRLFDLTNSLVIAEVTGINTDAIINLGTLSNLPVAEAILELQAKVLNTDDRIEIHSLHLYRA